MPKGKKPTKSIISDFVHNDCPTNRQDFLKIFFLVLQLDLISSSKHLLIKSSSFIIKNSNVKNTVFLGKVVFLNCTKEASLWRPTKNGKGVLFLKKKILVGIWIVLRHQKFFF